MTINAPGTKTLPEAGLAAPVVDESIPWDELSEGSREYLEGIRISLQQVRDGETVDADESMRAIRRELGIDGEQSEA